MISLSTCEAEYVAALVYVIIEEQLENIFTKPLQEDRYIWLRDRLGMDLIGEQ
uniref:Uncharacterized protein n=1 Tax=Cajanus cajan TaxID=3821 RepID=A0A151TWR2_CAJCA|nr:hypothetical protein KK1_010717 [Cajanus cajan]